MPGAGSNQIEREVEAGMTAFINPTPIGISGVYKQRYSDFLVNEVQLSGTVLHLATVPETVIKSKDVSNTRQREYEDNNAAPAKQTDSLEMKQDQSDQFESKEEVDTVKLDHEQKELLTKLTNEETVSSMEGLLQRIGEGHNLADEEVFTPKMEDKQARQDFHQAVRETCKRQLQTNWDETRGVILIKAAPPKRKSGRKRARDGSHDPRGGKRQRFDDSSDRPAGRYLHFTMLKINRETQDVCGRLSRSIKGKGKAFSFAGNKDRRGVTVQRMSGQGITESQLRHAAGTAIGWVLGDFKYENQAIQLGDLAGNEFTITLRDLKIGQQSPEKGANSDGDSMASIIEQTLKASGDSLLRNGFINYFGLQRFGTHVVKNPVIGIHMLQGRFKDAVDGILAYHEADLKAAKDPNFMRDNRLSPEFARRAEAISMFYAGQKREALSKMSKKTGSEFSIMSHLSKKGCENDYKGALDTLFHKTKTMYGHAYQSLIWNLAASHRLQTWPGQVVEGDLVLLEENDVTGPQGEVDEDGEAVIIPQDNDRANSQKGRFRRARALTAEEATSGKYTLFDIVLPMPGWDMVYPKHMEAFYRETMGSEKYGQIDPHNMRRSWKDLSLSGDYHYLLSRPINGVMDVQVREYTSETEQFVETDAQRIEREQVIKLAPLGSLLEPIISAGPATTDTKAGENGKDPMETDDGSEKKTEGDREAKPDTTASKKYAAILKFQLRSGEYATMALRELLKGGVNEHEKEFVGGHMAAGRV